MKRLTLIVTAMILCVGCFVDTEFRTEYILKTIVETESGGDRAPLEGCKAYAFYADTTAYKPLNYSDAEAGVITSADGDIMVAPIEATPYEGSGDRVVMTLDEQYMMLLVVDTQNKCYAYTNYEVAENLPQTFVTLLFRAWKNTTPYKDGKWWVEPTIVEVDDSTTTE